MEEALLPAIREALGELAESAGDNVAPIKFLGDLGKIAWSLPDRILFRKIDAFLKFVPEDKREEFARRAANEPGLSKKIGEHLILALDHMDDLEKAEVHGKVFVAYAAGKIQIETLRRLSASINAGYITDLKHIYTSPASILEPFLSSLLRSGLSQPSGPKFGTVATFELTPLGKIFQQLMRDEPITV
jgi:hypothetical protein